MALSNWDTLSINELGESLNGIFVSPLGVEVSFYKNWLYVRDEKAWQDGGAFIQPTVMQIDSGNLQYKDVHVEAVRGPQNGVFALITTGYGQDIKAVVGCGVSGYEYPPAPCGHDANVLGSMSTSGEENCPCGNDSCWHTYCAECEQMIPEAEWVGVNAESIAFLKKMLLDNVGDWLDPEEVENHVFTKMAAALDAGLRFNQGDAFFAAAFGTEIPATPHGEADEPSLSAMWKAD